MLVDGRTLTSYRGLIDGALSLDDKAISWQAFIGAHNHDIAQYKRFNRHGFGLVSAPNKCLVRCQFGQCRNGISSPRHRVIFKGVTNRKKE